MTKILDGKELAGFIKERQSRYVKTLRSKKIKPCLLILRDSDNPVILKYVELKKQYGEDIGVEVIDGFYRNLSKDIIKKYNEDESINGIIVQLPLLEDKNTEEIVGEIAPEKDVDGLANYENREENRVFDSATATAINWLLAGHNINLEDKKIAIVGRGKLVGAPLIRMWTNSGYSLEVFHRGSDFNKLKDFDIIVTATGNPHLITSEMIKPGAVVVDAGTASEGGHLVGDINDEIRNREDLTAITPKFGGVGPLTVSVLFEDVLKAAENQSKA
ncbi:MAG: bifunctional 5,10-methylenetetrahydrofolate dehydrogenase/5,10-methenyltetrahydrofolate cyclohydrolase [Candidatus Saccharibacteria bacterium]|nr:bifunctional 5,10-methylenetetrahydrofolate dehydrogenase/5,10-methenyltetrahydrofolate cyclohydrolase [Candidatus Saccharibacteria bacterium]